MVDRALDIEKPRRNGTYKPKDKPSAQPEPAQAQPSPAIAQAEEAKPEEASEFKHKGRSDALNELIQNKIQNKTQDAPDLIIKAAIGDGEPEPITFILNKMADRVQALEQAGPQEQVIRNISQDGITITKNAKGAYQWEIVSRASDMAEAIDKALRADRKLREELGRGGGPDA